MAVRNRISTTMPDENARFAHDDARQTASVGFLSLPAPCCRRVSQCLGPWCDHALVQRDRRWCTRLTVWRWVQEAQALYELRESLRAQAASSLGTQAAESR